MKFKKIFNENLKTDSAQLKQNRHSERVNKVGLNIVENTNSEEYKKIILELKTSQSDKIIEILNRLNKANIESHQKITLLLHLSYRDDLQDTRLFKNIITMILTEFEKVNLFFKVSIMDMFINKIQQGCLNKEHKSLLLKFFLTQESLEYLFDEKKQLMLCLSNRIKKIIILLKAQEAFLEQIQIFKSAIIH